MSKNYHNIKAVRQIDETTCWAASLEWWLKAVVNRGEMTQEDALQKYHAFWKDEVDGVISKKGMFALVSDPLWQMSVQWCQAFQFTPAVLAEHLARGPIYVGYYEKKVKGNHVNVIYKAVDSYEKGDTMRIGVMEPSGGKHKTRHLNYYQGRGEIILASPKI